MNAKITTKFKKGANGIRCFILKK